jgi:hypothetical protein
MELFNNSSSLKPLNHLKAKKRWPPEQDMFNIGTYGII